MSKREFQSETRPLTQENYERARSVLALGQEMDWLADEEPMRPHKMPCVPIDQVEWLFGFADSLLGRVEAMAAVVEAAAEVDRTCEGGNAPTLESVRRLRTALDAYEAQVKP